MIAETGMDPTTKPLIMAVDDDPVIRELMKDILTEAGCEILIVQSGEEALEMVQILTPDLIFLDVELPGASGYEVCAKLQEDEKTSSVPVVFVTGKKEEEDRARAFAVGAVDYMIKPFTCEDITHKVKTSLKTCESWRDLGSAGAPVPAAEPADAPEVETAEEIAPDKTPEPPPRKTPTGKSRATTAPEKIIGDTLLMICERRNILPTDFVRFKHYLCGHADIPPEKEEGLLKASPDKIYALAEEAGISPVDLARHIAGFLGWLYLEQLPGDDVQLGILPTSFCKANQVVAIRNQDQSMVFAFSNPFNWDLLDILKRKKLLDRDATLAVAAPDSFARLFSYNATTRKFVLDVIQPEKTVSELEQKLQKRYEVHEDILSNMTEESEPIILLVNKLIDDAYQQRASDIHIEPREREIVVRYRIDGALHVVHRLRPSRLGRPLVSRIKIMSQLDIAERRLPQDGRIVFKDFSRKGLDFDLRVSIAPMTWGEKVVMRVLEKKRSLLNLEQLGFSPHNLDIYRDKIRAPYGMILNVGPTGSGKSMTLYAAIAEVSNPSINIQTIEDPIEYTLSDINQLQVHHVIGLTFARALRCYLRQDPNIILVGEIRDLETAQIAVEASLTGHMLLSTLHTNDASSTISRLLQMGIPSYLVSASLVLICAQRLLRRLCPQCREIYRPRAEELAILGGAGTHVYRAKGCRTCNNTGYRGRIGIHELLPLNDALCTAVNQPNITAEELKRIAVAQGMRTLYEDALDKVRQGICSLEDVMVRVGKDR